MSFFFPANTGAELKLFVVNIVEIRKLRDLLYNLITCFIKLELQENGGSSSSTRGLSSSNASLSRRAFRRGAGLPCKTIDEVRPNWVQLASEDPGQLASVTRPNWDQLASEVPAECPAAFLISKTSDGAMPRRKDSAR